LSIVIIINLGSEEPSLKFAKIVFIVAGILGILQLLPLYFLFDFVGRNTPPAINHPEFYFGFAGVALAWQFVFLLIGNNPYRYRVMMLPSILEKASYVLALLVLSTQHRIAVSTALPATSDLILGLLFIAAYIKTKAGAERPETS
jgi:hypothetical protein